jgi:glycosyltransferase involved in cell wall biosynthesis
LVIPSRWKEPLGIVALEGLSAGCRVIASRGGGLAELEPYGVQLFESGKVDDLVKLMHKMQAEHKPSPVTPEFEKCFSLASVGDDYLELFKSCES